MEKLEVFTMVDGQRVKIGTARFTGGALELNLQALPLSGQLTVPNVREDELLGLTPEEARILIEGFPGEQRSPKIVVVKMAGERLNCSLKEAADLVRNYIENRPTIYNLNWNQP